MRETGLLLEGFYPVVTTFPSLFHKQIERGMRYHVLGVERFITKIILDLLCTWCLVETMLLNTYPIVFL